MTRPVKFCVRMHQHGYAFDDLKEVWTEADRLAYHSASLYDLLNIPTLECWTTLSALAAVTENLRLIPMVLANTYRPPALMAKMASTLDVISKGRLELGIGAGGGGTDHQASGYAFPSTAERVRMLDEAMVIIKGLWSGELGNFEGRYYRLENAHQEPRPVQQPHPPILIGGHGERHLLRVAARHAEICNIGSEMTLEEHRQKLAVLERHCREAGRDFGEIEISHNALTLIAETQTEFDQVVARRAAQSNVSTSTYRDSLRGAIAGTPDQCAEQIQGYVDAGITYFFLIFPDPVSVDDLRLFAREVMPRFAAV